MQTPTPQQRTAPTELTRANEGDTPSRLASAASLYRRYAHHYRDQRWRLAVGGGLMLCGALVALLQPWPLSLVLDHIILEKPFPAAFQFLAEWVPERQGMLLALAVGLLLISVLGAALNYWQGKTFALAGQAIVTQARQALFAKLQRLSIDFTQKSQTGDLIYRLTSDVESLGEFLTGAPRAMLGAGINLVTTSWVMFAIDWRLGLAALGLVPVVLVYTLRYAHQIKRSSSRIHEKESQVASLVAENLNAMAMVQAFGNHGAELARFETQNTLSTTAKIERMRLSNFFKRLSGTLGAIGTAFVIFVGAALVLSGELLPGTLIVFGAYLKRIYNAIDTLSAQFVGLGTLTVAAGRLLYLFDAEDPHPGSHAASAAPSLLGHIEFRNVTFGYRPNAPVLHDLSFQLQAGRTLVLVGHSGAGKSTLVRLLLRFYEPDQGEILMDGHPIRAFEPHSLREQITMLFQEAVLLNATIRGNIKIGNPAASDAQVIEAAKRAQAHDFISALPQKYDTRVAEGGHNLSLGQRQRISIARAVLKDAPILVLDEPTTGLDALAETQVNAALEALSENKTTLVIAHRFSHLVQRHPVLFFDQGAPITLATHQALLENNQNYRALYALHNKD